MKIKIIAVGKIGNSPLAELINDYQRRINKHHKLVIEEVNQEYLKDNPNEKEIALALEKEGNNILKKIKDEFVIALDIKGKNISSNSFAQMLEESHKNVIFIIGSSHGLADKVKQKANFLWSFSLLTFPHLLIRLMLCEQIYRSTMIWQNHPYHK